MNTIDQIIIYQTDKGDAVIDVKVADESTWLALNQIPELFGKNKSTISRHINSIFNQGELLEEATVAKNATVQFEGGTEVERTIQYYNLDAIISVVYWVKSKRGTQFSIWANKVLKEYLVKGYALNEKRLKDQELQLIYLKNTFSLLKNVVNTNELSSEEAVGLLRVVTDYAYALDVLDKYDHQQLAIENTTRDGKTFIATYEQAMEAI
ncbi:virulence RhuM family protein [Pedobacter kyungheensis]|uniref:virulence RhuM family protein n=1 Tax=Pedobacter kyungheensis TaxID=1069985 RepID=UPI000A816F63|nr:RhuM family protein [Pedobacter kyungheensis]